MKELGFVRVGAIVNKLHLADPLKNADEIIKMIKEASEKKISIVSTPELSLTGYTCGDLFFQKKLLNDSLKALEKVVEETKDLEIISILGLPILHEDKLFDCAVVTEKGRILGVVPKSIMAQGDVNEGRWFNSGTKIMIKEIELLGQNVAFDTNLIFRDSENRDIAFAIEVGTDLFGVTPPSTSHTLHGATMIFNLASSNEIVGRASLRGNLVSMQSLKMSTAYIYVSSGMMESGSDLLFSGSSMIYECGKKLVENKRFEMESNLIYTDIDVESIVHDRMKNVNLRGIDGEGYQNILVNVSDKIDELSREYKEYPFVPGDDIERVERCEEILNIQASALARRLVQLGNPRCVVGMSGGLDSTLAFLIIVEAFTKLGRDMKDIIGITMPGFGTTGRTYNNACSLVKEYGTTLREVSIKEASLLHMKDIGLSEDDRSVTYENIQARERTQILMDVANMENGLVIGTGDLSELALGWCTYNGDHMSMYSVNADIPKTLVRYLVKFIADNASSKRKTVIDDILDTPISPELLPPDEAGNILQQTESSIGPYVLHDFYLYHFIRHGFSPKKIYVLAKKTFNGSFSDKDIIKWLKVFVRRFFTQQFKRNCVPDGVKVGSVGLSPRGDLVMPSDASYETFLREVEELEK